MLNLDGGLTQTLFTVFIHMERAREEERENNNEKAEGFLSYKGCHVCPFAWTGFDSEHFIWFWQFVLTILHSHRSCFVFLRFFFGSWITDFGKNQNLKKKVLQNDGRIGKAQLLAKF